MLRKLIQISLCTLFAMQSIRADIFFEASQEKYDQVVFLLDFDDVIANQKGALSQLWGALTVVPFKKSKHVLFNFKKLSYLIKTMMRAQHDGQNLKGAAANIDFFVELEPSLRPYRDAIFHTINDAWARKEMVSYLQEVRSKGIKLISATNNDYESLSIKIEKMNTRLAKKQLAPFVYDAYFCAGLCPENKKPQGIPAGSVYAGKDSDEYFTKIFSFVETEYDYNRTNTLFVFVDDKAKNITRARNVAKRENVSLCAVHRNRSDKKIIKEMQTALSAYITSTK